MLFAEEMNSYFGGPPSFQPNNPTAAAGSGTPMEAWKGPNPAVGSSGPEYGTGGMYAPGDGGGGAGNSKLMTKWGHPMDYGKMQTAETPGGMSHHHGLGGGGGAFTPTGHHHNFGGGAPWNSGDQHHSGMQFSAAQFVPQHQQQDPGGMPPESKFSQLNLKAPSFQPSGHIAQQQQAPPSGLFTPPVDLVNGQWGRGEINQATPWNLEMNGADPNQQPGGPPGHPRYRNKWEQQQQRGPPPGAADDGGPFGPGGYGGPMGGGGGFGMPGVTVDLRYGGGERMMPGGMPQFGASGGSGRGPPIGSRSINTWDPSGGGGNKFVPGGGADLAGPGGASHRNAPSGLFSGPPPPPPLHSMNMMPPRPHPHHPPAMFGHMPPPPLLPSLNLPHSAPGAAAAQFGGIGSFAMQNGAAGIQQAALGEDSVWQVDPNGELRKWQRDTGTSIWGDPAKQANIPIQRWQQFTADEVAAKSNLLAKEGGELAENGWGELPPIGAASASGNSNGATSTTTVATNGGATAGGGQHQFGGTVGGGGGGGHAPGGGQKGTAGRGGGWNPSGGGGEQMTSGVWNDPHAGQQQPQQSLPGGPQQSQPQQSFHLGQQSQQQQQSVPGGTFVLPPVTTAASGPSGGTQQPPSLLAMIDQQHHHSSSPDSVVGGGGERKATTSPGQQQPGAQQLALKVSLAEELSTLGAHGIWGTG